MPILHCPLGARCKDGPAEAIWRTDDVDGVLARELLQDHVKFAHQAEAANAAPATMKAEKLVRPTLKVEDGQVEEETWEWFVHKWNTYKRQANLTVSTKSHLESCLGDAVTIVLFGRLGQAGWDLLDEETLLANVREVFVKRRNRMVNRLKLHKMAQGPDQPVQQYVASLKQIARTCRYSIQCSAQGCNTNIDYSNEMVLDQLVRGLNDDDIQKKVLSCPEENFNLAAVEKIIIAEESSKATQKESRSSFPSEQLAPISTFKKSKKKPITTSNNKKCSSCGSDELP